MKNENKMKDQLVDVTATEAIGNLRRGEMQIIASQPDDETSMLACLIAAKVIKSTPDITVVYFSLAMPSKQIAERIRLLAGENAVQDGNLVVDDTAAIDVDEICNRIKALKNKTEIELVVVDYAQLVNNKRDLANGRCAELAGIGNRLRELAKEENVAIALIVRQGREAVLDASLLDKQIMKNENKTTTGANKRMKNRLNSKLEYYYGCGAGRYGEVLQELRVHGGVHSYRTSSIPLAEFWQPDNLERITTKLKPYLPGFDAERSLKFFEFPTDPEVDGKCIGRASMTDLMLMDGDWQIALEAKYTEYSRMPNETVEEWLRKDGVDFFIRRRVGKTWLRYIQEAKCSDLRGAQRLYDSCGDVCYQFLHRTASACYKTNGTDGHKPVLVYELFYDENDPVSREDRIVFERDLKRWAGMLRLKNMKFLIMSVPVINAAEVKRNYAGVKDGIFDAMAMHTIYKFDFDGIKIEDVDLGKEAK